MVPSLFANKFHPVICFNLMSPYLVWISARFLGQPSCGANVVALAPANSSMALRLVSWSPTQAMPLALNSESCLVTMARNSSFNELGTPGDNHLSMRALRKGKRAVSHRLGELERTFVVSQADPAKSGAPVIQ